MHIYTKSSTFAAANVPKPYMAGLYIHIPFCKSRCIYCDFFSTTRPERQGEYVDALLDEWDTRQGELDARDGEISEPIRTIYFGGGTPSLLTISHLQRLLQALPTETATEITLECNPGDVTPEAVSAWHAMGINRLSLGIQSFDDRVLQAIGRRHTARQAKDAVRIAQDAGFDNISIDLIYGIPTALYRDGTSTNSLIHRYIEDTSDQALRAVATSLDEVLRLGIQHISTYCLTYEDGTRLMHLLENGTIEEVDEDTENRLYDYIADRLLQAGFEHYEVSNFALPGYRSRHNSSYWNDTPYIGLGAGAHSYDGRTRRSNPADLDLYIRGIRNHSLRPDIEVLTPDNRYNEHIMLSLRTSEGLDYQAVNNKAVADDYIRRGLLRLTDAPIPHLVATRPGLHILNRIIEDLMQ